MISLMSKELIPQFRWSDRSKNGGAFSVLKNTQTVLFIAMLQVDQNYTIYQFQNDCKAAIKKFSTKKSLPSAKESNELIQGEVGDESALLKVADKNDQSIQEENSAVDAVLSDVNNKISIIVDEKNENG